MVTEFRLYCVRVCVLLLFLHRCACDGGADYVEGVVLILHLPIIPIIRMMMMGVNFIEWPEK